MSKRPARAAAPRYFSSWRQAEAKAAAADALVANDAWGEIAAHVFQDLETTSAWRLRGFGQHGIGNLRRAEVSNGVPREGSLRVVTLTQALESPYEVMECRESNDMAGPGAGVRR